MRQKKLYTTVWMILLCYGMNAQTDIKFIEEVYDFGFVTEGEQVTHDFEFENNGSDTLKLLNVKPSCGCTTPNWPRNPFLEGESGEIRVSYNSKGRVGRFQKYITVSSNATNAELKLVIKGVVVAKNQLPADSLVATLPIKMPNLSFERTKVNLGKLEKNKQSTTELIITNQGKETVTILNGSAGCSCIRTDYNVKVEPGESIPLSSVYTARGEGKVSDKLVILTDEVDYPVYEVVFYAEVVESLVEGEGVMHQEIRGGFGF